MTTPAIERALLLCAGLGTRIAPLSQVRAKPAVPLLNRPLVAHQLERLAAAGVRRALVNLHHLPETVLDALAGERLGLEIEHQVEPVLRGTGGALRAVAERWPGRPFFVLNGDTLALAELSDLVREHRRSGADATLLVGRPEHYPGYGGVRVDGDGRLLAIADRPQPAPHGRERAFLGVHAIEPAVLEHLPDRVPSDLHRDVYANALGAGRNLRVWCARPDWYELGDPDGYRTANLELLARDLRLPDDARREEGLAIQPRAELSASARAIAPCLVGSDVRIGAGARVERSVIGPRCSIEPDAEVVDSVLWTDVTVGRRAAVRRAVLTDGVRLAAGASVVDTCRTALDGVAS